MMAKEGISLNKLIAFLLFTILLSSNTFASMPVEVTITGCVEDGTLIAWETDFGTHKVQGDYKIKVYDHKDKSPIDLRQYNGKIVKIKGYLLPGDVFYVDRQSIITLGNCPLKKPGQSAYEIFESPIYKGYRLDWCRVWGEECGKGAADAFCKKMGYSGAESWEIDPNIGDKSPTIIIATEQICNQSFCGGFKYIKCVRNSSYTTQIIFNNGNIATVYNNPTKPTIFTISQPHVITFIQNYHWNNARGSTPGTIALRDQSGRTYGPWQAEGSPGQGGVPNAYWNVYPNITLPAGTYTVIDSELSTWSQNSGSNGAGFTRIEGYPVSAQTNITGGTSSGGVTSSRTIQVRLKNNSNQNVHLYPEGDFPSPNNRIAPGETRTVNIPIPSDGFLRFCAGRNGQTIQCNKKAIDPNDQSRTYTVILVV